MRRVSKAATGSGEQSPQPGEHLLAELKWVHEAVRHDLAVCKQLAAEVEANAAPEEVRERIRTLKTNGPLWRLRVNCLYYCRFVQSHHRAEDVLLFPAVREAAPDLNPTVDKLESDHREVAVHLDTIEAAAEALIENDDAQHRVRLTRALEAITGMLLAHLEFEEQSIGPVLLQWAELPLRPRSTR